MHITEPIIDIILSAGKLPGYKKHPLDTYDYMQKTCAITGLKHPKDIYNIDIKILLMSAEKIVVKHKREYALSGFAAGLPGGPWGMAAGNAIDLEEYLRGLFVLSQEIGHVYGIIPNPFIADISHSVDEYFESVKEQILKSILIGLGVGGVSIGITEIAELIAEKESEEILREKVSEKIVTELAKNIGKAIGVKVTTSGVSKLVSRAIPIIGGLVNAYFNYKAVELIGNNLIKNFKREHLKNKPRVKEFWDKGGKCRSTF